MFSDYAISFLFLNKAFAGGYPWAAQTMPEVDLLIISHDHCDYLDLVTLKALIPRTKRVITSFGVGSYLHYWGMRSEIIEERDWNQPVRVTDSSIVHVLPARHFSGCGIKCSQALWASSMFETPGRNAYYGGDSGYGPHSKAIGEQFGSVDLTIMGNGQYDQGWKPIHMVPEETAQATVDLYAKAMLPGHADRFVLAKHTWDDSYKRLALASRHQDYQLLTPMLGEPVILPEPDQSFTAWWRQVTQ